MFWPALLHLHLAPDRKRLARTLEAIEDCMWLYAGALILGSVADVHADGQAQGLPASLHHVIGQNASLELWGLCEALQRGIQVLPRFCSPAPGCFSFADLFCMI